MATSQFESDVKGPMSGVADLQSVTGYEKSPDYGGSKPTWRGIALLAVGLIGAVALLRWLMG